ncbi:metallophosphoesterase [candidate division KSB1 bacterium]|nr:metallophosphoesterase [candidate division KSB1 bacterium]
MKFVFPIVSSIVLILGLAVLASYLLAYFNKRIWNISLLKKIARYQPYLTTVSMLFWMAGIFLGAGFFYILGGTTTAFFILFSVSLIISLPVCYLIYRFGQVHIKKRVKLDESRRRFLKYTTGIFPAAAFSVSGLGVMQSFTNVRVPVITIGIPGLPPALEGLKIAHLSDLHLGYYFSLGDLEKTLEIIDANKPDIYFVTGDIADDIEKIDDALKLICCLRTPCQGFASVGNHEYYRNIDKVIRAFDKRPLPLLLNTGTTVQIKGENVYIGGADDPVFNRLDMNEFFEKTVTETMLNSPEEAFRILMSHRPGGFDTAHRLGVNLTLSGHTHGGQIGFMGRSLLDGWPVEKYQWGLYKKGKSRLYTSSGMGVWFPFRLGCPAEAPILILRHDNSA